MLAVEAQSLPLLQVDAHEGLSASHDNPVKTVGLVVAFFFSPNTDILRSAAVGAVRTGAGVRFLHCVAPSTFMLRLICFRAALLSLQMVSTSVQLFHAVGSTISRRRVVASVER